MCQKGNVKRSCRIRRNFSLWGGKPFRNAAFLRGRKFTKRKYIFLFEKWDESQEEGLDFSDIKGQEMMKRAAEIAVSGKHNLLMIGPPGSGGRRCLKRLPTILPPMTLEESVEVTRLYSVCGLLGEHASVLKKASVSCSPPYNVGSGTLPEAAEFQCRERLHWLQKEFCFLDELPEFSRSALEVLRQPLEEQKVTIARVGSSHEYPSDCSFVAAMNPCRCGYYPNRDKCRCTTADIKRYLAKISEPLLDRMDLCVETGLPEFSCMRKKGEQVSR